MFPTIQILPGFQKRLMGGYPWVYANEILPSPATKELSPGQAVYAEYQGQRLALGYYNRHSLIAFRALTRELSTTLDADFFLNRLKAALSLRERFYKTPYYRLIHAEADGLPGLIIDRFDSVFVIQINTQGMEQLKTPLLAALQILFNPTTLYLKNDSSVRQLESLPLSEPEIIGQPLSHLTVIENKVQFKIELASSQKTGWFYDHQENRRLIATLTQDKSVLDYFCYSGGYSLHAATAGAKRVIGVDRSESAIQNAKVSAELNGVSATTQFVCKEIFEDLEARLADQERYDVVLLDPPAFVKSKKDLKVGLKGYEKLLTKAIKLINKDGLLLIASCSYHVKEADLNHCLMKALYKNQREGRLLRSLSAGFDHPKHPYLEESSYLKGFLVCIS